jgi:hypothetical protein
MSLVGNKMGCWIDKKRAKRMSLLKIPNIIQRLARINRVPTTNPRGKWSTKSLEAAMDAIEKGTTS